TNVVIENGYLSMLAASTIETYERTWEASFTDIGFNNRLFLVPGTGEKKDFLPKKIPKHIKDKLMERLGALIGKVANGHEYSITDEANAKFQKWYMAIPSSTHSKRLDAYAHRLMMLLALNESKTVVDIDIANKVIDLVNWQFTVRQAYDPIDADNSIAKMETRIKRQLRNGAEFTERELKMKCHSERSGLYIFMSALQNLERYKEVELTKGGKRKLRLTSGRKALKVHPFLHP
ncbi:hypothetical protein LCGC14_2091520, partial [marine sediment metagenome]